MIRNGTFPPRSKYPLKKYNHQNFCLASTDIANTARSFKATDILILRAICTKCGLNFSISFYGLNVLALNRFGKKLPLNMSNLGNEIFTMCPICEILKYLEPNLYATFIFYPLYFRFDEVNFSRLSFNAKRIYRCITCCKHNIDQELDEITLVYAYFDMCQTCFQSTLQNYNEMFEYLKEVMRILGGRRKNRKVLHMKRSVLNIMGFIIPYGLQNINFKPAKMSFYKFTLKSQEKNVSEILQISKRGEGAANYKKTR